MIVLLASAAMAGDPVTPTAAVVSETRLQKDASGVVRMGDRLLLVRNDAKLGQPQLFELSSSTAGWTVSDSWLIMGKPDAEGVDFADSKLFVLNEVGEIQMGPLTKKMVWKPTFTWSLAKLLPRVDGHACNGWIKNREQPPDLLNERFEGLAVRPVGTGFIAYLGTENGELFAVTLDTSIAEPEASWSLCLPDREAVGLSVRDNRLWVLSGAPGDKASEPTITEVPFDSTTPPAPAITLAKGDYVGAGGGLEGLHVDECVGDKRKLWFTWDDGAKPLWSAEVPCVP